MQIDITPEKLQQALEIGGMVASGAVAIGAMWWKFSKWLIDVNTHQDRTSEQLSKLADVVLKLTENVSILTVKLDEREKDTTKLEGALEVQRKDMVGVIAALQKATGSLDALWKTLQNMENSKVPRRLSDKG